MTREGFSPSKTASIIKATPEKIAADRSAERNHIGTVYEADCDLLDAEHDTKVRDLQRVVDVKDAAWTRANAEFETSLARMDASFEAFHNTIFDSEEDAFPARAAYDRLVKFTRQLQATACSLVTDGNKALNALDAYKARYISKHEKLYENYCLAWSRGSEDSSHDATNIDSVSLNP